MNLKELTDEQVLFLFYEEAEKLCQYYANSFSFSKKDWISLCILRTTLLHASVQKGLGESFLQNLTDLPEDAFFDFLKNEGLLLEKNWLSKDDRQPEQTRKEQLLFVFFCQQLKEHPEKIIANYRKYCQLPF